MSKLVYIATPYRSENKEQFKRQLEYTKSVAHDEVKKGNDVIVPHLYYPSFLDDNDDTERALGMKSAIRLMLRCDEVLVGTKYGISEGVRNEVEYAIEHDILIRVRGY